MNLSRSRYHAPGTSPGALIERKDVKLPLRILLFDYDSGHFEATEQASVEQCVTGLASAAKTWIHIEGSVDAATLRILGEAFSLHALALEDVLSSGHRPKVDRYGEQLFAIMALPYVERGRIVAAQVSLFLGKNYVISFQEAGGDIFEPIRRRLRAEGGRMRNRGSDYLFYALIDVLIDHKFPLIEALGDRIEDIERAVLDKAAKSEARKIHALKRDLLTLRRFVWPEREVVNRLRHDEDELIKPETRIFLADCYDHTVQIMDLLESYRDMAASLMEVYVSSVSNRLNDVIRVLTVISTVFMPLTFLTGVYGMNFDRGAGPFSMPELGWPYAYVGLWVLMLAIAGGMVLWFRRRGWF